MKTNIIIQDYLPIKTHVHVILVLFVKSHKYQIYSETVKIIKFSWDIILSYIFSLFKHNSAMPIIILHVNLRSFAQV